MTGPVRLSRFSVCLPLAVLLTLVGRGVATAQPAVIDQVLPRVAKVFGSGGLSRLESWQTAIAVSPDGLFLTAWSYVLDSGATVVLNDGRRFEATVVGYHPRLELALLRIDVTEQPSFDIESQTPAMTGMPVLAFSNLYGIATGNEPVSVQRGIVSAITNIATRRGPRSGGYRGRAIIVDATINNPGAAGGAITNHKGQLLGIIGRESRNASNNLWLNYAIPVEQISVAMDEIISGQARHAALPDASPAEPVTLELLGLVLVPDVVANTPGWIEQVVRDSPAARAGFRVDDLIVEIDSVPTATRHRILEQLMRIDRDRSFPVTIQRDGKYLNLDVLVDRQQP